MAVVADARGPYRVVRMAETVHDEPGSIGPRGRKTSSVWFALSTPTTQTT